MAFPNTFRFTLFGPPQLAIDHTAIALPPQPAAFCAFLVLNRQRRITREEVQAAFWPDAEPARAQERLRRTLYLLRRAIEPHTGLVATEGNELAIAPSANLWVDYEAFEKALMDAYRHDPPNRQPLEAAVAFYSDDLLKDVYADWVLFEREHARQQFLTAVRHLIGVCQHEEDWGAVIRYGQLLLEQDPFQEAAHRALMTAYAATGDRSAALRQYRQCAQILDDELAAEPMPETTRLFEDIRQGRGVTAVEIAVPVAPPVPVATDLQWVPLVGRERELAEIAAEWRTCQHGNSRLVLVTGSAGMGKTRLVEEAASRIPGSTVRVITGNCHAMEAGTPYQLISDLMRKAADGIASKLDASTRAELAQLVPELLRGPSASSLRSGSAPDASVRLQEAVTQVIRFLASSGDGLWLVTEDLHWADPASLACLNHALRRCSDLPLMVLATLRDEEVSFDSPLMDWPTSSVHAPAPTTLIRVEPLPPDQLALMLSHLVAVDTSRIADLLYRETAGNPLFIVETLRALIEQGVLYAEPNGSWRLRVDALPRSDDLPMSDVVLHVIRGRIRRLSRPAQEVLMVAAVVEHDIEEKLLARLVDPSLALDLALEEILHASILAETDPGLYQFTHIKVREIIYADTSAPRRRFLHHRAAEVLANRSRANRLADVAKLAYHYTRAHEWTPALIHAWRAAQTALAAGAMAEANRYAGIAQDILDEHGGDLDLEVLPESLAAIRFDVLALQAEFRRQAATAGLYYPPDMIQAIEALLPAVDDSRRAKASLQQAIHALGQGDLAGARDAAGRGRGLYADLGDLWGELDAMQHQADIAYRAGDMVTMHHLLDDMRRMSAADDQPEIRQMLAYNEMRQAVFQGAWIDVLNHAQALSSWQQARFDPSVAWLSLANLGLAYMKLGAYDEAYAVARQAVEASEDANVLGLGARVLLAKLELLSGNLAETQAILLNLLETPDPLMGEVEVISPALTMVRCCVATGDADGAKQWAKRASRVALQVKLPILYPLSQVGWALADLAAERYDDARQALRYPFEFLLLLEDTSPQEIFVLRAAAARGLNDDRAAADWLHKAWDALQEQAAVITRSAYRESFLECVPLHRFVMGAHGGSGWVPHDVLRLQGGSHG
jgi:DNA-binding SARP family transcriptional activator